MQQSEWQRQQQLERARTECARVKRLELLNNITGIFKTPLSTEQIRLLLMALGHLGELDYAVEEVVKIYYAPRKVRAMNEWIRTSCSRFFNPPTSVLCFPY